MSWSLQKISNGIAWSEPGAVEDITYEIFVCVYNDQQHFTYRDASGNIQDAWWDGNRWHLQKINNRGMTPGPPAEGDQFVSVYSNQQHFTYRDTSGNIQDCWYDGSGKWNLQQINNANGSGATVPDEYVATAQATAPAAGGLFVSVYSNQQHFTYRDASGNIWDSWWSFPEIGAARVVEVSLPNNTVAFVQAADLDADRYDAAKAGRKDVFNFDDVSGTLEGIARAVRSGLQKVTPSKTTVELGIQLALKNGKLTGLIVEGKAEASLKVTLEWGAETSADNAAG